MAGEKEELAVQIRIDAEDLKRAAEQSRRLKEERLRAEESQRRLESNARLGDAIAIRRRRIIRGEFGTTGRNFTGFGSRRDLMAPLRYASYVPGFEEVSGPIFAAQSLWSMGKNFLRNISSPAFGPLAAALALIATAATAVKSELDKRAEFWKKELEEEFKERMDVLKKENEELIEQARKRNEEFLEKDIQVKEGRQLMDDMKSWIDAYNRGR